MSNATLGTTFNRTAIVYEILSNAEARLAKEEALLKKLVRPGLEVLDLACGTGAHALWFADHGARVHACDLSPNMIAYAGRRRPHQSIRYEVRNMCGPPDQPFDLVCCLGNSVNLLPNRTTVTRMLAATRCVLNEGGALLLHAINPQAAKYAKGAVVVKHGEIENTTATVIKTLAPIGHKRVLSVTGVIDPEHEAYVFTETNLLLDLQFEELRQMIEIVGYTEQKWYGGMDGKRFRGSRSRELVVLAR